MSQVSIVYVRSDDDDNGGGGGGGGGGYNSSSNKERDGKKDDTKKNDTNSEHRGFGFVTFNSIEQQTKAIEAGTIRGCAKINSKRKHTLYIRPVVRDEDEGGGANSNDSGGGVKCSSNKNICFLWQQHRCPYGEECKFVHEGEGGSTKNNDGGDDKSKKKQKCFAFKKSGKCKLGDECPYSHDVCKVKESKAEAAEGDSEKKLDGAKSKKKDKSQVDCINWKNKGKCRKGDKCPFKHDATIRDKVIAKKNKNKDSHTKQQQEDKTRAPLSIRVFGLNYDTKESDIRSFFEHCGPIMEITFPTFEDSGRSKGYCGVLFQSPKAVEKAVAKDGEELHGRWLSIQEGKMYLRKWEEVENGRKRDKAGNDEDDKPLVGEYGQKVKKRKHHGFEE